MTNVVLFDIFVGIQSSQIAIPTYVIGITAFKHRHQPRNFYPTKSMHALTVSYLYNYGDFTPFNTFMFMYINIYGEIDSCIKKIVIQLP